MAKKGTYSAFQQLKPTTGFDPVGALMEVGDYQMRQNQDKRADDYLALTKRKYEDDRNDLFAKAMAGDYASIEDLNIQTGKMGLDEAMYGFTEDVKENLVLWGEKWGKEGYSNPKALAERNTLLNSAKYVSKATQMAGGLMNDISAGLQPSMDKNGNPTNPLYSQYNRKYIDIVDGVVNGKYKIGYVNGRPFAAVHNENGGVDMVDVIALAQGEFGDLVQNFDYGKYLSDTSKGLGYKKTTNDKGVRTIVSQRFEDIEPELRKRIEGDFGTFDNLTDMGKSYLADEVGMSYSAIDELPQDVYKEVIDGIVNDFKTNFKSEYENTANTQLINSNESARSNKAKEKQARDNYSLAVKKEQRLSKTGQSYATEVFANGVGGVSKSYSIPKGKSVYVNEETGEVTSYEPMGVKSKKFQNIEINDVGQFILTDGMESHTLTNRAGVTSIADDLGFSTVSDLQRDANNSIAEYRQSNPNVSNQNDPTWGGGVSLGQGNFNPTFNSVSVGGNDYQ